MKYFPEEKYNMLCFVHIERAAGTTFHGILRNNFLNYLTLVPWNPWTNEEDSTFKKEDLRWLIRFTGVPKGIGGHTVRSYNGYEEVVPDVKYVTFLREPINRWVAHFQYQNDALNKNWTIEEFLGEKRLNNFMTKRIAGCYDVEKAKRFLSQHYLMVGLTERFDESLLIFKKRLGIHNFNICYEKKNVAKRNELKEKIMGDEDVIKEIQKHNSMDMELYDYVKMYCFQVK